MNIRSKNLGLLGVCVPIMFLFGNLILFYKNPNLIAEIRDISIVDYNLSGLTGQYWAAYFNYLTVGIFSVLFLTLMLRLVNKRSNARNSLIMLLFSAILYSALGFISYETNNDGSILFVIIVSLLAILLGGGGFVHLSFYIISFTSNRFLQRVTFFIGIFILLLTLINLLFLNRSGIVIDLLWSIYFIWYGIAGICFYCKPSGYLHSLDD